MASLWPFLQNNFNKQLESRRKVRKVSGHTCRASQQQGGKVIALRSSLNTAELAGPMVSPMVTLPALLKAKPVTLRSIVPSLTNTPPPNVLLTVPVRNSVPELFFEIAPVPVIWLA